MNLFIMHRDTSLIGGNTFMYMCLMHHMPINQRLEEDWKGWKHSGEMKPSELVLGTPLVFLPGENTLEILQYLSTSPWHGSVWYAMCIEGSTT